MAQEKQFYLLSLKWTYPNSTAFTLWRDAGSGYCWYKEWAGLYSDRDVNNVADGFDTIAVPADLVKSDWVKAEFDGGVYCFLLNTPEIRRKIVIERNQLQGGMQNILKKQLKILSA